MQLNRLIAMINTKNKHEAIVALEILLEKVKEYGSNDRINEKIIVTNEGDSNYCQ